MDEVKDYNLNISAYVLFSVIEALEGSYGESFPHEIKKQISILKRKLINYIEPNNNLFKNRDFKNVEYYMKVFYDDKQEMTKL